MPTVPNLWSRPLGLPLVEVVFPVSCEPTVSQPKSGHNHEKSHIIYFASLCDSVVGGGHVLFHVNGLTLRGNK